MATLYLEPGGDLLLSPSGGLQMATGWDEVRQRIVRRVLTSAQTTLPSGEDVQADYIFSPSYGLGLPRLVGENMDDQFVATLQQVMYEGVLTDQSVDTTFPPLVNIINSDNHAARVLVSLRLSNGQPGRIALEIHT